MTYIVTIKQAGRKLAEVKTEASDALEACWKSEQKLNAKRNRVQLINGGKTETFYWTGLDCTARRTA